MKIIILTIMVLVASLAYAADSLKTINGTWNANDKQHVQIKIDTSESTMEIAVLNEGQAKYPYKGDMVNVQVDSSGKVMFGFQGHERIIRVIDNDHISFSGMEMYRVN